MNSVLSALQPHAHVGSNGFDVSHRDVFSTKPGIALPAFYRHVPYKSTFRFDVANIVETTTLQTNAFARGSFNLDFYFVPYNQMFRPSDEIILGRGQSNRKINSPLQPNYTTTSMPVFPLGNCLRTIFKEWLIGKSNGTYSISGTKYFTDVFGENAAEDSLRILDMLGYGNFLPLFKFLLYHTAGEFTRNMSNDEFISSPWTSSESNLPFEVIVEQAIGRELTDDEYSGLATPTTLEVMCMLSGTFTYSLQFDATTSTYIYVRKPKYYNVFNLAAYQKIWSDMYRNFIYDTTDYVNCFNFDWMVSNAYDVSDVSASYRDSLNFIQCLLMPRYRQWKKDLFTGTYPSAQFGDVAFQQVSDGMLSVDAGDHIDVPLNTVSYNGTYYSPVFPRGTTMSPTIDKYHFNGVGISALDIRYTMAMQRYRERLLRSGNRTKDVLEAQFGISSRYIEDDYVEFLGSFSGTLNINKVAGTTNEGDTSIGELGAYANSSIQGKTIERSFNDSGIVMGILTFVPETEYDALMVDPFNTKSEHFDYYQSDFENLGLSPVFGFELDSRLGNSVLGYTARYHEYKMAVDKVHGEFHGTYRPLVADVAFRYPSAINVESNSGVFSDYVTPRDVYYMSSNNWLARYYINPKCMNNIFLLAVGDSQDTDPFKIDMNYMVSSVQPMSVTGMPQL